MHVLILVLLNFRELQDWCLQYLCSHYPHKRKSTIRVVSHLSLSYFISYATVKLMVEEKGINLNLFSSDELAFSMVT